MTGYLRERQHHLIEENCACLRQAAALLATLTGAEYAASPAALPGQRAGAHLRHVIEFYECLLGGLHSGHIDYESRRRDPAIETERETAIERLAVLVERLETDPSLRSDPVVWVRLERAREAGLHNGFVMSTLGRELQVLASHAVHHFALIGFVLRLLGVDVPSDFGVAPSTLAYRASLQAA